MATTTGCTSSTATSCNSAGGAVAPAKDLRVLFAKETKEENLDVGRCDVEPGCSISAADVVLAPIADEGRLVAACTRVREFRVWG